MAAKFDVFVDEKYDKLPMLYRLPKLYKIPCNSRFIANYLLCASELSIL